MGVFSQLCGLFQRAPSGFATSFTAASLPVGTPSLATFPTKRYLGASGMFAWRLRFQVSQAQAPAVLRALASFFPLEKDDLVQFGFLHNPQGQALNYTATRELGGVVVELITNCIGLMDALDALQLDPVPPWLAFPRVEPAAFGSLPPQMDYWWSQLWLPFWSSLDIAQRQIYLERSAASADWRAFIAWHTPHGA